jgi:hypothetical protein
LAAAAAAAAGAEAVKKAVTADAMQRYGKGQVI